MSEYPDEDEEFELMYGDEFELLREQEDLEEPPTKSRKTLDFSTPSKSNTSQKPVNSSFDQDFVALNEDEGGKKRSVQDLFGDIDDILYDDENKAKKLKTNTDEDKLALIDYILELRKLAKDKFRISARSKNSTNRGLERDKNNLSYNVPKYPFIGVTNHEHDKIYIRFHSEEYEKEEMERVVKESACGGVLGDTMKSIWDEARALLNKQMDEVREEVFVDTISSKEEETKQLWVDLYKPRKYLELLSDESTNRIMLKWIKLWDKVVFNRKAKEKVAKKEGEKFKIFQRELVMELDEDGRPHHKVALLCGPPGLGKTTLAHMVAKHAGYNVVEVNASDDRSLDFFKTSLEHATQMRSVIDQENRPNCLVFDEIDGAPQASIDYLVKFVNGTAPVKAKKGQKNKKPSVLKRPIICICNDVFVPALKPLRQISFVVNFPQTSSSKLAERLMEITRMQKLRTDIGAMLALAEKSHNDIRSCLSVLHFFKARCKAVTLSEVYKSNVGQKDMQKGLFSVWEDIFRVQRPTTKVGENVQQSEMSLKARMEKVLHTVSSFGDYDRLAQGVFANYPHVFTKSSTMEGTCQSLEWFSFTDMISKQIYATQNYTLSSYLQYAFVVWHFVFASLKHQKLQYPSQGYEVKMRKDRQAALVAEVLRGMPPSIRVNSQKISLTLDTLPLISKIIVPSFRPISLQLYTAEERNSLLKVVNIMIDYNLNYVQERTAEGTYVYNLDPNIDDLVVYDLGEDRTNKRVLSYSNKQLIAREIDQEKMRRLEKPKKEEEKKPAEVKEKAQTPLPNHLQTLKAKTVKKTSPTVRKDFFGRIVEAPAHSAGKVSKSASHDVWYQYKEGYNNAVRKNIKISSLK